MDAPCDRMPPFSLSHLQDCQAVLAWMHFQSRWLFSAEYKLQPVSQSNYNCNAT
jgi:hypothetical protein